MAVPEYLFLDHMRNDILMAFFVKGVRMDVEGRTEYESDFDFHCIRYVNKPAGTEDGLEKSVDMGPVYRGVGVPILNS